MATAQVFALGLDVYVVDYPAPSFNSTLSGRTHSPLVGLRLHPTLEAMTFEAVQQEITTWDEAKLRKLIAYAVVVQDRNSGRWPAEMTRKLDDPDANRWISLGELDRRLGFRPEELAE